MYAILKIWLAALRYSLARDMMFRGSFLFWIVVALSWFALQLAFVQVLYLHVDVIAGWTKWEMILLVSLNNLTQELFEALFAANFLSFPELVRTGKLDFYLLQPAPVLFLATTRRWDIGLFFNALFAVGVTLFAASRIPVHLTAPNLLTTGILVGIGVSLHYAVMLFLMTFCFWMTRTEGLLSIYYQLFQLARQPRETFRGSLRFIFTWILPLLLVANLPARIFFSGIPWSELAGFIGVTAALLSLSIAFFHFGLRHYTSASS